MLRSFQKFRFCCQALQYIKYEEQQRVAIITLNRPKALNALCDGLISELNQKLLQADSNAGIGAIIITGSEKSFAAGADIKEMQPQFYPQCYQNKMLEHWDLISSIKTPIIAGVNGFALGGGCELAMLCDIIIAGDKAKFGQPEIKLGTIPGCGGTVRLTQAMGKSKAMEYILTGDQFNAEEALKYGLVSKIVPADQLIDECVQLATKIADYSKPATQLAKESVNQALNQGTRDAVQFEKRLFHSTFSLKDRSEGMTAFVEKRKAKWQHE